MSAHAESDQTLDRSKFLVRQEGIRAVILFPSLATPGLVQYGSSMTVIIAVHEEFVEPSIRQATKRAKGAPIDSQTARLCHSHLRFMDWGGNSLEHLNAENNERQYMAHIQDIKKRGNMIYHDHMNAIGKHALGEYKGWFLGELPSKGDFLLQVYGEDQKERPFGVLHGQAVELYHKKGYKYLFQLEFKDFERYTIGRTIEENGQLKELVWLYLDYDALKEMGDLSKLNLCCIKPNDEVLLPLFDAIMRGGKKESNAPVLMPHVGKPHPLPACSSDPHAQNLHFYRLHGSAWYMPQKNNPQNTEKSVPETKLAPPSKNGTKDGFLFTSRHPVFISGKEHLNLGAVSDLHLSIRQSLYAKVSPRVIHDRQEGNQEGPNASANIGEMAHHCFKSSRSIMEKVAKNSDVMLVPGDIFDFCRNTNPALIDGLKNTGALWDCLDFVKRGESTAYYIDYIDLLAFLALVYEHYEKGKPLYFVSGNHDGYKEPYGMSPRLHVKFENFNDGLPIFDFLRMNEGIPADHNLTYYEAVLLYGPKYASFYNARNFSPEILGKVHCLLTPWKDCTVSYGSSQNLLLLGWGDDEAKILQAIGYNALPTASTACTDDQLALVENAVRLKTETGSVNVLCSHFTYTSFTEGYPFLDSKKDIGKTDKNTPDITLGAEYKLITDSFTDTSIGTFFRNRSAICEHIYSGDIDYTISGHSHRAGAYALTSMYKPLADSDKPLGDKPTPPATFKARAYVPKNATTAEDYRHITIPAHANHAILVCGSAGCYSRQNLRGEFGGLGLDKPRGLTLDIPNRTVDFVPLGGDVCKKADSCKVGTMCEPCDTYEKDSSCKKDDICKKGDKYRPRLAVVMDYLWFAGVRPFSRQNDDSRLEFYCPEGSDSYAFTPSRKWTEMFGFASSVIDRIEIYATAMDGMDNDYIAASVLGGRLFGGGENLHTKVMLDLNKQKLGEIFPGPASRRPGQETTQYMHFMAVHFKAHEMFKAYDTASPWCFPVNIFNYGSYGPVIYRAGVNGGEIPDFKKLEIPDYAE